MLAVDEAYVTNGTYGWRAAGRIYSTAWRYAGLVAYQKALIIFQATCLFSERFLEKRNRIVDQMIQAAWPGKQNIVEASKVSGTSKEAENKLRNVFRSSLEELREDYTDFLRKRKHPAWPKNSRE